MGRKVFWYLNASAICLLLTSVRLLLLSDPQCKNVFLAERREEKFCDCGKNKKRGDLVKKKRKEKKEKEEAKSHMLK